MTTTFRTAEPFMVIEQAGSRWLVDFGGSTFHEVKAAFKAAFPHKEGRLWLPKRRRWSLPPGSYARLLRFARAHYSEGQIVAPPVPHLGTLIAAPELIRAAQRALAALTHPDDGGAEEAARAVRTSPPEHALIAAGLVTPALASQSGDDPNL